MLEEAHLGDFGRFYNNVDSSLGSPILVAALNGDPEL